MKISYVYLDFILKEENSDEIPSVGSLVTIKEIDYIVIDHVRTDYGFSVVLDKMEK